MATIYAITDSIIEKIQKADLTANRGYRSSISSLDNIFRLDKKQLTIITGKANNGKTTFLDYYTYMLAKNAGLKTLFLSFETDINLHLALFLQYADKEILKSKLYFADTTEISTIEQIIKVIIEAKENYNIDNIVIDPFNYISTEQAIDTNAICYILKELRQAAKKYNVSVILVAHPRKMQADEQLTGESIAGSIHFSTVADNILIISTDFNTHKTTVRTDKIRYNKMQGEINATADFLYCVDGTYIENTEDELFGTVAHVQQPKPTNKQPKPQEAQRIEIAKAVLQAEDNKINYNELMQTKVAYMDNVCAKQSDTITLQEALTKAASIQDKQAELRLLTDKAEMQKYKRNNFPAIAPSVVFTKDGTTKENVKQINPIICVDIDGQDNNYMSTDKMKEIVSKIPYVFYAQESASGRGIFCFVQISDTDKFKGHFNALSEEFKVKGLIIDAQCSDINRKRFVAYDPNPYINRNATIYKDTKEDIIQPNTQNTTTTPFYCSGMSNKTHQPSWPNGWSNYTDEQKAEYIVNQCIANNILINKSHADSLTIASALKTIYNSTDTGLNYCLQLRQMRKGTDISKQKYMYQTASTKTNAVGCLVNLYKSAILIQN